MKFGCDSCGAQYLIADEKLGPRGVKVRCKRCSNVIILRPPGYVPKRSRGRSRSRRGGRPSATGVQVFGVSSTERGEATVTARAPKLGAPASAAPVAKGGVSAAISIDVEARGSRENAELTPFSQEREGGSLDVLAPRGDNGRSGGSLDALGPAPVTADLRGTRRTRPRPPPPPPADLPGSEENTEILARDLDVRTDDKAPADASSSAEDAGSPPGPPEALRLVHGTPEEAGGPYEGRTLDLLTPRDDRETAQVESDDPGAQAGAGTGTGTGRGMQTDEGSSWVVEPKALNEVETAEPDDASDSATVIDPISNVSTGDPPGVATGENRAKGPSIEGVSTPGGPSHGRKLPDSGAPDVEEPDPVPNASGDESGLPAGLEMSDDLAKELGTAFEAMFEGAAAAELQFDLSDASPDAPILGVVPSEDDAESPPHGADAADAPHVPRGPQLDVIPPAGRSSELASLANDEVTAGVEITPPSEEPSAGLADLAQAERPDRSVSAVQSLEAIPVKGASSDIGESPDPGPAPSADLTWFVAIRDEQVGPLAMEALKAKWAAGELTPESLCWRPGMTDWTPIAQVSDLADLGPVTAVPRASSVVSEDIAPVEPPRIASLTSGPAAPVSSTGLPSSEDLGWRPSAASALASLAAEEMAIEAPKSSDPEPPPSSITTQEALGQVLAAGDGGPTATQFGASERSDAKMLPLPGRADAATSFPLRDHVEEKPRRNGWWIIGAAILGGMVLLGLIIAGAMVFLFRASEPRVTEQRGPTPAKATVATPPAAAPKAVATPPPSEGAGSEGADSADARLPGGGAGAGSGSPSIASASAMASASSPPPEDDAEEPEVSAKGPEDSAKADRSPRKRTNRRRRASSRRQTRKQSPPPPPPSRVSRPVVSDEADLLQPGRTRSAAAPSSTLKRQLDESDLFGVMRENRAQIMRCRERQAAQDPRLEGTMTVEMVIERSGRPSRVRVTPPKFKSAPIGSCVTSAVRRWRFPKFSGRAMPVDFPVRVGPR